MCNLAQHMTLGTRLCAVHSLHKELHYARTH